jgi:hypothetical protein
MTKIGNTIPFSARVTYAKHFIANGCFRRSKVLAEYLITNKNKIDFDIELGVLSGLAVTYGKPFYKSQGIDKFTVDIVPKEFTQTHNILLGLRDKLIAHSDLGAKINNSNEYFINVIYSSGPGAAWEFGGPIPNINILNEVCDLCSELCKHMMPKIEQFNLKYADKFPKSFGRYNLNIRNFIEPDFIKMKSL